VRANRTNVGIALDATYSLGSELSGVGIYSRELLNGLAATDFAGQWEWFYRSQRFWRALFLPKPDNVIRRFLSDAWGSRAADLFHGLNQRLPKRRFVRQIATFHDLFVITSEYSTAEFRERFAAQAREAAAAADMIIAVSEFTASQVEDYLNVPRARIRVVHHGVIRRKIPELPREKIVLCTGAVQRRKNQSTLIKAFRAMPDDWSLILAGSAGFAADEAQSRISDTGRVRLTGYVAEAELARWYARASIFAFPSLDEGFGMPVLEAMAAGVPVIAGNRSALPEVCGEAALLVDPQNEEELASALLMLAKSETRRSELTARGLKRADRFSWKKAVAETLGVYREILP
jgi:glycosyltransferase involved in cell wall biosynthesis